MSSINHEVNKPEPNLYYDWFDIRKYFEETGNPINIRELPYMYEVNNGELFCVDEELFDDCQQQNYIQLNTDLKRIIKEFGEIEMKVWW